jgi:hypothetical protein
MTLQEIEQALQESLIRLQKAHDEGFERPSFDAWLDVYRALAEVRNALASERIANALEHFTRHGIGVESMP